VDRFISEIADSDLILTSRLHGVIFCARMAIPFVSIGAPDEKVERESQALEHSFHLAYSANSGEIADTVRNAWADRTQSAANLQAAAARREALARRTLEALHACN
jgi:exopolysaccharide biosynthesis predicted pyruvyltransferase EpsI